MAEYNHKEIEKKWQDRWEKDRQYIVDPKNAPKDKYYILPQLPYPSGSGLHVGHAEVYNACDIVSRYQRMQGKDVLQVFGLDSFGLPAENYAIKTNVHPKETIDKTGKIFCDQVRALGISVDWDRFVRSSDPGYYKWTQWFFLLMYKRGLAYRKKQTVNWCEKDKTVLANEQVVDGQCERCETEVIQKEMEQWYLKITEYADRLHDDLDKVDWNKETITRQRNWIGRSEGALLTFDVKDSEEKIAVFTTAHDTIYGATFMVLAPEHTLVQKFKDQITNWNDVETYIAKTKKKTELDRQIEKEKTGVALEGVFAINPINGKEIPVWVADYVLASYGTGAIMAVPGSDERDYQFAQKFGLDVISVVAGQEEFVSYGDIKQNPGDFTLQHSDEFDGQTFAVGRAGILKKLEENGHGKAEKQFKLRDWSVSRQRFWGAPIPMLMQSDAEKKKFIFIHGYTATKDADFWPWLQQELEDRGHEVWAETLPGTGTPQAKEQAQFILENAVLDQNTTIICHSHGGPVAFRMLEQLDSPIEKVLFVDTFYKPEFTDKKRPPVEKSDSYDFDFIKIKEGAHSFTFLHDSLGRTIGREQAEYMAEQLDARLVFAEGKSEGHFHSTEEPDVLEEALMIGLRPLSESDLPVELPDDVDFKPTGQSPLTYSEDFQKGIEEKYGKGWKREVDTLDTFMCSSWYFFRYLDPKNDGAFASPEALKAWMPVDYYLGGEEHVNGHLLYSRFFTKVLFDAGYIDFDEPFLKNRHQGLILGEDNRKMSKRWGNVIDPTDVINEYGADTLRMYEMFMGPLEDTKPWSTNGVKGVRKFVERVWRLQERVGTAKPNADLERFVHQTIKKVSEDTDQQRFNTAIAKMMELANAFYKHDTILQSHFETLVLLLAPYAPHIAEELWEALGHTDSVTIQAWPTYDETKVVEETVTLVVQINGKVRAKMDVSADIPEDDAKAQALAQPNVIKWLEGKEPKKVIFVKGKLISIVV